MDELHLSVEVAPPTFAIDGRGDNPPWLIVTQKPWLVERLTGSGMYFGIRLVGVTSNMGNMSACLFEPGAPVYDAIAKKIDAAKPNTSER